MKTNKNEFGEPSDPVFLHGKSVTHSDTTFRSENVLSESPASVSVIRRHGVVAVVPRPSDIKTKHPSSRDYLVIRRSDAVIAPGKLCFPGGGIEANETAEQAVCREFWEEVGAKILLLRPIWENVTPWNVHLRWFLAHLVDESIRFSPQKEEVAECRWMNFEALLASPDALSSNVPFLEDALDGRIDLSP